MFNISDYNYATPLDLYILQTCSASYHFCSYLLLPLQRVKSCVPSIHVAGGHKSNTNSMILHSRYHVSTGLFVSASIAC